MKERKSFPRERKKKRGNFFVIWVLKRNAREVLYSYWVSYRIYCCVYYSIYMRDNSLSTISNSKETCPLAYGTFFFFLFLFWIIGFLLGHLKHLINPPKKSYGSTSVLSPKKLWVNQPYCWSFRKIEKFLNVGSHGLF